MMKKIEACLQQARGNTDLLKRMQNYFAALQSEHDESPSLPDITALLLADGAEERQFRMRRALISTLGFNSMPERFQKIPLAYSSTFNWALEDQYHTIRSQPAEASQDASVHNSWSKGSIGTSFKEYQSFGSWLVGTSGLYWITGKPGAGKSTLMKFLSRHAYTLEKARGWASASKVTTDSSRACSEEARQLQIAEYFFWNSGSDLQKSKVGLCRTLLFRLLIEAVSRVDDCFPDRWSRYLDFFGDSRPFTWDELWTALKRLLSTTDRRYLLFIDGLDEIDEKPEELASIVIELSKFPAVKLCASSRPWPEFEDAFYHYPRLRVEDLTRPDIHTFVSGHLGSSRHFCTLERIEEGKANEIVRAVTDKACGVFLWVYIAVESLLEGLRDGDEPSALLDRLDELPSELDELFTKILSQVKPRYAKEASELFQFIRYHKEDASLLGLLLSQATVDTALKAPVGEIQESDQLMSLDSMRRRIYSRCKCLLLVATPCTRLESVDYLHRTVRDYLYKPDVWERIRQHSPAYDHQRSAGISLYLQAKQNIKFKCPDKKSYEALNLAYAINLITATGTMKAEDKIELVKQGDNVGLAFARNSAHPDRYDVEETWFCSDSLRCARPVGSVPAFADGRTAFHVALELGWDWYVDHMIRTQPYLLTETIDGHYPLCAVTKAHLWHIVPTLLKHGADPNFSTGNIAKSPWYALLTIVSKNLESGDALLLEREELMPITALFLDHGAFPRARWDDLRPMNLVPLLVSGPRHEGCLKHQHKLDCAWRDALRRDKNQRRLTFKSIRP